jgi:hypothetical protein
LPKLEVDALKNSATEPFHLRDRLTRFHYRAVDFQQHITPHHPPDEVGTGAERFRPALVNDLTAA